MQPSDGFAFDGGPMNSNHNQIPAGSRLNQYLGANRQGSSFGSNVHLHINAPPFIPKNQQQQQHQSPLQPPLQPPHQQFVQLSLSDSPVGISHGTPPFGAPPSFGRQPQPPFDMQSRYQLENRGGTMYFYQPPIGDSPAADLPDEQYDAATGVQSVEEGHVVVNMPTSYSLSHLPVPHIGKFRPKGSLGNGQTQFINPELKMDLLNRQLAVDLKPDMTAYSEIPQQIEHLTNLVPLENVAVNNLSQTTYKAASIRDGVTYCIRRIHGYRVQPGKQTQPVESWKKLCHGNLVQMREIILNCRNFDDSSVIFVYDYYPLAQTLKSRHFDSRTGTFLDSMTGIKLTNTIGTSSILAGNGLPESTLWSYVIQISAALRAIHASGLAARSIDLTKILIYSNNKILLSFCGISDVINPDHQSIQVQQQEDLHSFGCVLIALATGKPHGFRRDLLITSMSTVAQNYSTDMKNLISYLASSSTTSRKSINDIMPMIGARFYSYMENMQQRNDCLEAELCKELENGRLFRLLCKMNTVLERFEHNGDENWSETGDRYMLKLFRDFVFHQVTDQGKPWLDMAHIVQCLNKLDAGTSDKLEMVSRDGDSQLVVDFSQLKRCLEKSFRELFLANVIPRH